MGKLFFLDGAITKRQMRERSETASLRLAHYGDNVVARSEISRSKSSPSDSIYRRAIGPSSNARSTTSRMRCRWIEPRSAAYRSASMCCASATRRD